MYINFRLGKKSDAGYESVPYNKLSDQSSARAAPQMPLPGNSSLILAKCLRAPALKYFIFVKC